MSNIITTASQPTADATAADTATTSIRRRTRLGRIGAGLATLGAVAALSVGAASSASAQQYGSFALAPGQGACSQAQYASYQVRADFSATGQGAKFKLLRNGVVVWNTATRSNGGAVELRSAYGNFPGPGYYTVCAQNTGTTNTIATMQLRTDYEF